MQVTVVSDSQGNIQSLSGLPQQSATLGMVITNVLEAGERVDILDVPVEFEKRPLAELHARLRVTTQGGRVTLVPKA